MHKQSQIHLLMNDKEPVGAYTDKALADADCWLCNDAEKFSPDPMPYWVKTVDLMVYEMA